MRERLNLFVTRDVLADRLLNYGISIGTFAERRVYRSNENEMGTKRAARQVSRGQVKRMEDTRDAK